jgi:hypothetical protein
VVPVSDAVPFAADPEDVAQNVRALKVRNDTTSRLTLWVRYRTQNDAEEWAWLPGDREAVCYDLDPGEETFLSHLGRKVCASRVRIWAETAAGEPMDEFKEQDLWLVPETDDSGEHLYYAPEMENFTFVFSPAEPSEPDLAVPARPRGSSSAEGSAPELGSPPAAPSSLKPLPPIPPGGP